MLDPISYSLAKKALKQTKPVIPSQTPITLDNNLWFNTNNNNLYTYHFAKNKWALVPKYTGYTEFDNNLEDGIWTEFISIPITTPPSNSIQYLVEINGDEISIYSNDLTTKLTTASGGVNFWRKVNLTGSDIRVFDETLEQNYFWIETLDYNSMLARIWVNINAGQEYLNITYGNPNCNPSSYNNGTGMFAFFDDFSSYAIGSSINNQGGWEILSADTYSYARVELVDGRKQLYLHEDTRDTTVSWVTVAHTFTFNQPYYITTRFKQINAVEQFDIDISDGTIQSTGNMNNGYRTAFFALNNTESVLQKWDNASGTNLATTTNAATQNTYYIGQMFWDPTTGSLKSYLNTSEILSATDTTFTSLSYIYLASGAGEDTTVDYIAVRNYLSTDLTFGTPIINTFDNIL